MSPCCSCGWITAPRLDLVVERDGKWSIEATFAISDIHDDFVEASVVGERSSRKWFVRCRVGSESGMEEPCRQTQPRRQHGPRPCPSQVQGTEPQMADITRKFLGVR
jgi:hypothetical protein